MQSLTIQSVALNVPINPTAIGFVTGPTSLLNNATTQLQYISPMEYATVDLGSPEFFKDFRKSEEFDPQEPMI